MADRLNLALHCGAHQVEVEDLRAVHTPSATDSHCPIPHHEFLDLVTESLGGNELTVINQAHALTKEGNRYFGLLQVQNGIVSRDHSLIVGVRNSHDKSFPAAIAMGSGVFVCDNLAFSGEIRVARKHTRYIMDDLPELVARSVGMLGQYKDQQERRIAWYKDTGCGDADAMDVCLEAVRQDMLPKTKLYDVLDEWQNPRHPEFADRTAWSLFNSFTEILKGNLEYSFHRTQGIHKMIDAAIGLAL